MARGLERLGVAVVVVGALAAATWGVVVLTSDDETTEVTTIVFEDVGRADLRDIVVLRGSMTRQDRFTLFSAGSARVTAIEIEVDDTVATGDVLLYLDGRPSLAVAEAPPYWRVLDRRATDGPDIEQLETFLVAAGFDPGDVDEDFTSNTEDALEDWQAENGFTPDGLFRPTDLLPAAWPARVGTVVVEVGGFVGPAQPLFTFVEDEVGALVSIAPADRTRLTEGLPAVVEIPATGAEGQGVVARLGEAAQVDQSGAERYQGEIDIGRDLVAADGTAVRVEVILAEVGDALVVPVASVSLDGSGGEEVRILAEDGTITRVPVTTGLTEGALVEIVEGLDGSEQVIIEVRVE
ncbi:MAG: hypothetical protein GY929_19755 [Actinomycetia bacterium]|nr:hypothetical protein [Actinomycetes bacterium]